MQTLPKEKMKYLTRSTFLALFLFCIGLTQCALHEKLRTYDLLHSSDLHTITRRSLHQKYDKEVTFTYRNRTMTLQLNEDRNLFGSSFKLVVIYGDGTTETPYYDTHTCYTGKLKGGSNSTVSACFEGDVMRATIITGGEEITIETVEQHEDFSHTEWTSRATMVAYSRTDVIEEQGAGSCGAVHPDGQHGFDDISFISFTDESPEGGSDRVKRATDDNKACDLSLVADYKFVQDVGQGSIYTTANYIANTINRVNQIYRGTDFGRGLGYGFNIQVMEVHVGASVTADAVSKYPYNVLRSNWAPLQLLETFSQNLTMRDYCLGHLFTSQAFTDSVLGLAYIASPQTSKAGGICSPLRSKNGRTLTLNTGWTSARNGGGNLLTFTQHSLVTAHGHNWGSEHDPDSGDCAPSSIFGDGKYLMYAYAVSGDDSNNDEFSSCSRSDINAVLGTKADSCFVATEVESLCGNGRLDGSEECDGGLLGRFNLDDCCSKDCTLKPPAICSPANYPCCSNCQLAPSSHRCYTEVEGQCLQNQNCNGTSLSCPSPAPKVDGTDCRDGGSCVNGVCTPYCEYRNFNTCVCDDSVENSCFRCCRDTQTGRCSPYDTQTPAILADGRSCVQGYCQNGVCIKVKTNLIERFWDFIDAVDFDFLVESFKTNMVGCVIGFSLVLYIPLCIILWCRDRYRKKEWEKENSLEVRKDRNLSKDEDGRNVTSPPKPVNKPKPAGTRPSAHTRDHLPPVRGPAPPAYTFRAEPPIDHSDSRHHPSRNQISPRPYDNTSEA